MPLSYLQSVILNSRCFELFPITNESSKQQGLTAFPTKVKGKKLSARLDFQLWLLHYDFVIIISYPPSFPSLNVFFTELTVVRLPNSSPPPLLHSILPLPLKLFNRFLEPIRVFSYLYFADCLGC